jgi:hypothetical protein
MRKWYPVRKIAAVMIGSGLFWVARQFGVDLGAEDVNDAAMALSGIALGYLVKEKPRA